MRILYTCLSGLKKYALNGLDEEYFEKVFGMNRQECRQLSYYLRDRNTEIIIDECGDPDSGKQGMHVFLDDIDFSINGYCFSKSKLLEYISEAKKKPLNSDTGQKALDYGKRYGYSYEASQSLAQAFSAGYNEAKQEFFEGLKTDPTFREVIKDTFIDIFKDGIRIPHDPIPGLITSEGWTFLDLEKKEEDNGTE